MRHSPLRVGCSKRDPSDLGLDSMRRHKSTYALSLTALNDCSGGNILECKTLNSLKGDPLKNFVNMLLAVTSSLPGFRHWTVWQFQRTTGCRAALRASVPPSLVSGTDQPDAVYLNSGINYHLISAVWYFLVREFDEFSLSLDRNLKKKVETSLDY